MLQKQILIKDVKKLKKNKNIIYGIALIILGIISGINALGIAHINLFFDGWWTLLLIVPCIAGIIKGRYIWANIAGVTVGTTALLICQNVIDFYTVRNLIGPVALLYLGAYLIVNSLVSKKQ